LCADSQLYKVFSCAIYNLIVMLKLNNNYHNVKTTLVLLIISLPPLVFNPSLSENLLLF